MTFKCSDTLRNLVLMVGLSLAFGTVPALAQGVVFPVEPEEVRDLGDGRTMEIYRATVVSTRGNRLTVRFPHGVKHTYDTPEDFRVLVGGQKTRVRDLQRGDELTAYVTKHEVQGHTLHSADIADAGGSSSASSVQPEAVADADELPSTASSLPLIGLLGTLCIGLGLLGFGLQRRSVKA